MPKERIVLLSLLLITAASAGILLLQGSTFSFDLPGRSRIEELEKNIEEYEKIIADAQQRITSPEVQDELREEIEDLRHSFFPPEYREHPGEFGKVIEDMAQKSGLDVTGIQAVATGFQFETEGSATAALRFLNMTRAYQYRISVPFCSLAYMRDDRWKCTVQTFPVFLESEETPITGNTSDEESE